MRFFQGLGLVFAKPNFIFMINIIKKESNYDELF